MYDISCQPTFDCLPEWLREIEEYANSKVLRVLVGTYICKWTFFGLELTSYSRFLPFAGNKLDREDREIPTEVGEQFALRHNMYYLETSAKEADNVERLFIQIAAELMDVSVKMTVQTVFLFHLLCKIFFLLSKRDVKNYPDTITVEKI